MDNLSGHSGVEKVVAGSDRQTTPGKDAPKRLPWVHVAIANAKTLFKDMYHGIKEEFLQVTSKNCFLAILEISSSRLQCGVREHSGLCDRVTNSKMPMKGQKR